MNLHGIAQKNQRNTNEWAAHRLKGGWTYGRMNHPVYYDPNKSTEDTDRKGSFTESLIGSTDEWVGARFSQRERDQTIQ